MRYTVFTSDTLRVKIDLGGSVVRTTSPLTLLSESPFVGVKPCRSRGDGLRW